MNKSIHDIIEKAKSVAGNDKQMEEFKVLFHDTEKEFELKDCLLNELNQTESASADKRHFNELFGAFWSRRSIKETKQKATKRIFIAVSRIAAVLCVGLFVGYYLHTLKNIDPSVSYYSSFAPKGSISELVLPDSTHIFLNSGSKIDYTMDGEKGIREVFLSGEAWFKVKKNSQKPFLVHTSFYNVFVTGTSFNVKAYPDENDVATTLEEGSVRIMSSQNMRIMKDQILKPGEQLVYNKETKQMHVGTVNTQLYTSWKDNKLIFINMSLKELFVILERKFGVDIEVVDPAILNYHYDGTIRNETIIDILELLKQTLPVTYKIEEQKVVIQKN